jgi:hypothetical protein
MIDNSPDSSNASSEEGSQKVSRSNEEPLRMDLKAFIFSLGIRVPSSFPNDKILVVAYCFGAIAIVLGLIVGALLLL